MSEEESRGFIIDYLYGKISVDDVIEEFNRVIRLEVLNRIKEKDEIKNNN